MGILGLACVFSTLVAVDGPLLQKATHVKSAQIAGSPIALNVSILPEIPSNFDSGYTQYDDTSYRSSYLFNETIPIGSNGTAPNNLNLQIYGWWIGVQASWLRNVPISGAIHGCPAGSECSANVRAPALAVTSCTSHTVPVDYNKRTSRGRVVTYRYAPPLNRDGLIIDVSFVIGEEKEMTNVITGHSRTSHCAGTFNYTACTLESGAYCTYTLTTALGGINVVGRFMT